MYLTRCNMFRAAAMAAALGVMSCSNPAPINDASLMEEIRQATLVKLGIPNLQTVAGIVEFNEEVAFKVPLRWKINPDQTITPLFSVETVATHLAEDFKGLPLQSLRLTHYPIEIGPTDIEMSLIVIGDWHE